MKKRLTLCAVVVLVVMMSAMSFGAEAATYYKKGTTLKFFSESPWYVLNDTWIQGQYPAQYKDGTLYVSLNDYGSAIGCYTEYNAADNSVFVKYLNKSIWQGVGYTALFLDGTAYENPAPYIAENGAVMIPAEPYASVIGYKGVFSSDEWEAGQMTLSTPTTGYKITSVSVNQAAQLITVYGKDPAGNTCEVRHMLCSTGVGSSTPNGTFYVHPLGRWYLFSKYNCYVMYACQITGDVCFHSIPFNGRYYSALSRAGYNALGNKASHGCIRLMCEDASFIYNYCSGLPVVISNGYNNDYTNAIRRQLISARPSYSDYVTWLNANGV